MSETPKTGFLASWPILYQQKEKSVQNLRTFTESSHKNTRCRFEKSVADPESFARGRLTLTTFFFFF